MHPVMRTRVQGALLVALGAALPLGEGVVWVAAALLLVMLMLCPRRCDWRVLREGSSGRAVKAYGLFVALGFWAVFAGGHGPLRPGEWGRQGPWVLLPLILLTMAAVPRVWHARAATGFVLSLSVAAAFGLVCYICDWRPGEVLLRPSDLAAHQGFVPGTARTVAGGFYFHRLKMAHVLLVGIGPLVARQLCAQLSAWRRTLEALALCLMFACLVLTYTRGAFLGVAAGGLCALVATRLRTQLRALVACVVLAVALMALPQVRTRLATIRGAEAAGVRGMIWSQAINVICDHPFGAGLGNYTPIIGAYYDRIDPGFATRTYPHNILLAAWAEAGPGGLIAYTTVWLSLGQAAYRRARRAQRRRAAAAPALTSQTLSAAAAGLFVTAALWTVGMTHDVLYHNVVGQAYVAALAWCLGARYHEADGEAPRHVAL